ncbi:MAG: L,D-transpeptidase family protein [Gaiellaceae bacterium]
MRAPLSFLAVVLAVVVATVAPATATAAVAGAEDTLSLSRPGVVTFGTTGTIGGTIAPARADVSVELVHAGVVVARAQTAASGEFAFNLRFASPGPYQARSGAVLSAPVNARIRPVLTASLRGDHVVGQPLLLRARLQPAAAGKLRLIVIRGQHRPLSRFVPSGKPFTFALSTAARHAVWVEVRPNTGYTQIARKIRVRMTAPALSVGSRGHAVSVLEKALIAHKFALLHADSAFGADTLEAVYALQKFSGLSRSGRMSTAAWLALGRSTPPRPRLHGSYIEVDKTKQVLYVVRNSEVTLIVPVSTGATGNTPIGTFRVYSKVPGGAVMYYSNYFIGGFAIHGYVSVPPYPASHGCVRVPMWLATHLYGLISYGMRVQIHY